MTTDPTPPLSIVLPGSRAVELAGSTNTSEKQSNT